MVLKEFLLSLFYTVIIVLIVKYLLVKILRRLAELLHLKAKTVGMIAGISTSVPELLTVSFSAMSDLISASMYNVISSNSINFIQYFISVLINRNEKIVKNKGVRWQLGLTIITILLPIGMICFEIEEVPFLIFLFPLLATLFFFFNSYIHERYHQTTLSIEEKKEIEAERKIVSKKKGIGIRYTFYFLLISFLLFIIGELLSNSLKNLCYSFQVPEWLVGILLGFITSIPELITFFEAQKHYKKKANEPEGIKEATNNLLTSNVLNLFVIQSIGIFLFYLAK